MFATIDVQLKYSKDQLNKFILPWINSKNKFRSLKFYWN